MFKTKRDQADIVFSKYIIKRDGRCVRCGSPRNLTNSHFWGRRMESVRFDPKNCDCLCISCHLKWEHEKESRQGILLEYAQWKLKQLGQSGYDALKARAYTRIKKDRKLWLMVAKELLKSLE